MSIEDRILSLIPQKKPFLFVDKILEVNDDTITGKYTFQEDEYFYEGHFEGNPITPGVILTECCAQIALVAHSIYFLLKEDPEAKNEYAQWFSNSEATFLKPVYPGETVTVSGKKSYFRHGKFKSEVKMMNNAGEIVCRASLSGMGFIKKEKED